MDKTRIYRALDANLNRAAEGIRAIEDCIRFLLDDRTLTARLRALRHDLRSAAHLLPDGDKLLLASRDSAGDAGRNSPPLPRQSPHELLTANFKRAQEAARSLEEFSKLLSPRAASAFGELRFRIYDIEKDSASAIERLRRPSLPDAPFLYAVADFAALSCGGTFELLRALIAAGCGAVQLRNKGARDLETLSMAREVAAAMKDSGTLFFVNDRVDIALAAGADGVHIGDEDIPVPEARAIAGGRLIIGASTHSLQQAMDTAAAGPDYISLGPVFRSPTKMERAPLGAPLLRKVCGLVQTPVVAIGGINAENIASAAAAGAAGYAVISSLTGAKNPRRAAAAMIELLNVNYRKPAKSRRRQ